MRKQMNLNRRRNNKMRTKRINTELYDTITVTDKSGNAIDFSNAYDINLYLQKQGSSSLLKQDFALSGNVFSYQFNSDENNRGLGIYDLHLEWKKKNANSELTYDQYHFDYLGCFKIVHLSDEENWSEGVSGTVLQFGADGLSAYEVAVKNGYAGTITEWLAYLRKPAVDAAASLSVLESSVSSNETTRNSNETIRIDNENERIEGENKRTSSETERANEESKRVTAENSRNAAESNRATAESNRVTAESSRVTAESARTTNENERVAAENARVAAETARESNSATAVTNANNAASNANTAASNFANAVVQEEGTNTDKVISQKVVTDELANKVDKIAGMGLSTNDYTNTDKSQVAQNKDTNSVQDTVVAEALAKLNQEFEAFKKMLQSGNIGDIHVTSVNTDSVPMYCGQQMIVNGSGSPITNAVVPDFVGQIYIDTTNRNAYMCCDSSSASYWKLIN